MNVQQIIEKNERTRAEHRYVGKHAALYKKPPGESKKLRKARKRLNARRNSHAATLNNIGAVAGLAYRCPGSMK